MLSLSKYHITPQELEAEALQIQAAKEDRQQFGVLYDKYYESIYRYVYQRLDSREITLDIVSQVFLKAMTKLHQYEYRGLPFSSWLYRIAKNELNHWFRSRKAQRVINADSNSLGQVAEELADHETTGEALRIERVVQALNKLSPAEVELIEMRYFEQRPFREIGEILGITENYAKVKVYRILDKMRQLIQL